MYVGTWISWVTISSEYMLSPLPTGLLISQSGLDQASMCSVKFHHVIRGTWLLWLWLWLWRGGDWNSSDTWSWLSIWAETWVILRETPDPVPQSEWTTLRWTFCLQHRGVTNGHQMALQSFREKTGSDWTHRRDVNLASWHSPWLNCNISVSDSCLVLVAADLCCLSPEQIITAVVSYQHKQTPSCLCLSLSMNIDHFVSAVQKHAWRPDIISFVHAPILYNLFTDWRRTTLKRPFCAGGCSRPAEDHPGVLAFFLFFFWNRSRVAASFTHDVSPFPFLLSFSSISSLMTFFSFLQPSPSHKF